MNWADAFLRIFEGLCMVAIAESFVWAAVKIVTFEPRKKDFEILIPRQAGSFGRDRS